MCGIVAYVGDKPVEPLLLEGLKRLEYRGYDSAGLARLVEGQSRPSIKLTRSVGRVSVLEGRLQAGGPPVARAEPATEGPTGARTSVGIAHTRWATHGGPTEANAHPHSGVTRAGHTIALVHNGIIENYATLRQYLEQKGHTFTSDTDTEVLAKLIAELYDPEDAAKRRDSPASEPGGTIAGSGEKTGDSDRLVGGANTTGGASDGAALERAVQAALREVTGAYAIAVMSDAEPHTLVCARKGSPLIVGLAENGYVIASDAAAIVAHTTQVITLEDYQVARLFAAPEPGTGTASTSDRGGATASSGAVRATRPAWRLDFRTTTLDNTPVTQEVRELEIDLEQIELRGYEHFMLKEIMEQPEAIRNCLRGRIDERDGKVVLGGLSQHGRELARARRIILTGQGTAYYAALVGEYLFEEFARVPAQAHYASEFRYRNPIIEDGSYVVAVSQSGETADTLAALREAKERGAVALGVVNAVGSSIARETDAGVYLHVGPEIGVASTKAFLGQVTVLTLIALSMGRRRLLSEEAMRTCLEQLQRLPDQIERVLSQSDHVRECVERVVDRDNWLFLGRGYNYPVAMEGALKLKELSYIHAEGMPAAEMKHGPIALIDEGMPVVFVATQGQQYEKVISNIQEVRARGGRVLAVATEGDERIGLYADAVFETPAAPEPLQPLLTVLPLQMLAYHAAVLRGHDVDKPRNLAKSVTVE